MTRRRRQQDLIRRQYGRAATLIEVVITLVVIGILAAAVAVGVNSVRTKNLRAASITDIQAAYSSGRAMAATAGGFPENFTSILNVSGMTVVTGPSHDPTTLSVAWGTNRTVAYAARDGAGCIGIVDNLDWPGGTWVYDPQVSTDQCDAANFLVLLPNLPPGVSDPRNKVPVELDAGVPASASLIAVSQVAPQPPLITWRASTGPNLDGYRILRDNNMVGRVAAGTNQYFDASASPATTYNYTVQAVNNSDTGFDPPAPVQFLTLPAIIEGLSGVVGSSSTSLIWTPAVGTITGYKVSIGGVQVYAGTSAAFVHDASTPGGYNPNTTYDYTVLAYNDTGDGPSATISKLTAPAAPTGLVGWADLTDVNLSWNPSAGALTYDLFRDDVLIATIDGGSDPVVALDPALVPGQEYKYQVRAVNGSLQSELSDPVWVVPFGHPSVPTITSIDAGNQQLTVNWDPLTSSPASPLLGYYVYKDSSIACISTVDMPTSCHLTGLTNGQTYQFQMQAYYTTSHGAYASILSDATPGTPRTVPDAPQNVVATSLSTDAGVTWDTPSWNGGASIVSYDVICSATGGNTGSATVLVADGNSATITGLTAGLTYTCAVAATNEAGTGPAATSNTFNTFNPPSTAPILLTATPGDSSATLTWTEITSTLLEPISGYQIYANGSIARIVVGSSVTTDTVTGLTNGTQYAFQVLAYNSLPGPASNIKYATPRTVPDPPTGVASSSEFTTGTVTYTPPLWDGGATIDSYNVTCTATGGTTVSADVPSGDIAVSGLTGGVAYTCAVRAHNEAGFSAPASSSPFTPTVNPAIPEIVSAVPGNAQVAVTWTPVSTTPLTGYQVYVNGTSVGCIAVGATESTCTVTSLNNGQEYSFQVLAYYSPPTGAPYLSGLSSALYATPRTAPDAPSPVVATVTLDSATLTFPTPWDGGAPIDSYQAVCTAPNANGQTAVSATVSGPSSPLSTSGLTIGHTYTCAVSAHNVAGYGASTSSNTFVPYQTAPVLDPAIPGDSQASLSWTPAAPIFGQPAVGYHVYRATQQGTILASLALGTNTATITGLSNGTLYGFVVKAYYPSGYETAASNTANVTPRTVPDPPTSVSATVLGQTVTVSFTPPAWDGGAAIDAYRVTCTAPSVLIRTLGGSSPISIFVPNSGTGQPVSCSVAARNAAGYSTEAPAAMPVTPYLGPNQPVISSIGHGNGTLTPNWTTTVSADHPVTGYNIWINGVKSATTVLASGATGSVSASVLLTGLTNGTTYSIQVEAYNLVGTNKSGAVSEHPSTVPGKPAVPTVATAANATGADVRFVPPTDGGDPITNYRVVCSPAGGGATVTVISMGTIFSGTTRTIPVTWPVANVSYTCTVAATNRDGYGPPSDSSSASLLLPGAPTGLHQVAQDGQVIVSWIAPASNGGSAITSYQAYGADLTTPVGYALKCSSAAPTVTCTGSFTNDKLWTIHVRAVTAIGPGPWSADIQSIPSVQIVGMPTRFRAVPPSRIITVTATPGVGTKVAVPAAAVGNTIPSAVLLGVTVQMTNTNITWLGGAQVYPTTNGACGAYSQQGAVDFDAQYGTTTGNSTPVSLDPTRSFCIGQSDLYSTGRLTFYIDLYGYYGNAAANTDTFHPITPVRVLDTSAPTSYNNYGAGNIASSGTSDRAINVAGGSIASVPANATAVSINLTAVSNGIDTYVTAYQCTDAAASASSQLPVVSQGAANGLAGPWGLFMSSSAFTYRGFRGNNWPAASGLVIGTATVSGAGLSGKQICFDVNGGAGGSARVIIDVVGYFTADNSGYLFQPLKEKYSTFYAVSAAGGTDYKTVGGYASGSNQPYGFGVAANAAAVAYRFTSCTRSGAAGYATVYDGNAATGVATSTSTLSVSPAPFATPLYYCQPLGDPAPPDAPKVTTNSGVTRLSGAGAYGIYTTSSQRLQLTIWGSYIPV